MESTALVVGEALIDVVRSPDGSVHERPGGSAANTAVALARLGRDVRFVTAYADDEHGRLIADHLSASDVGLARDPLLLDHTSTAIATLGESGAATYEFDIEWLIGDVDMTSAAPLVALFGSLGAVLEPGADQVRRLLASARETATVFYDINARPVVTGVGEDVRGAVEQAVALADIVKASDEDLHTLWPDLSLDDVAGRLLTLGPVAVLVTRGGAGATWTTGAGSGTVAAAPAVIVDTIGAGDTFGAAVVDGLWERGLLGTERLPVLRELGGDVWCDVLSWAAAAAAVTVSRPGADPPRRVELDSPQG